MTVFGEFPTWEQNRVTVCDVTQSTCEWPGAAHMKCSQCIWQYRDMNIKTAVCLDVMVCIVVVEVTF